MILKVLLLVVRAILSYVIGTLSGTQKRSLKYQVLYTLLDQLSDPEFASFARSLGSNFGKLIPYHANDVSGYWVDKTDYHDPNTVVFLFFHGGAYVTNDPIAATEHHLQLISLAKSSGRKLAIFALKYTLAGVEGFPKQLDEAVAAFEHLTQDLNISPSRIVIGGDSAGGNLTLATSITLRDRQKPLPARLVLISPWVDLFSSRPSITRNHDYDLLPKSLIHRGRSALLGKNEDNYLTSPIKADLHGLPNALIIYGGQEIFADDIAAFIEKYRADNGPSSVVVDLQPTGIHDFAVLEPAIDTKKRWVHFMTSSIYVV